MFWPFPCSDQEPWPGPPFSYDFYTCANGRDQAAPSIAQMQKIWGERNQMMNSSGKAASVFLLTFSNSFYFLRQNLVKCLRVCTSFHAYTSWLITSNRGIRDDRISMGLASEGREGKVENLKDNWVEKERSPTPGKIFGWNLTFTILHWCGNQSIWIIQLWFCAVFALPDLFLQSVWQM